MRKGLLFLLAFSSILVFSQNDCGPLEGGVEDRLSNHIEFLSSDDLKGRYPGTEGEQMAAEYIARNFEECGLNGGANGSFFQAFTIPISINPMPGCELKIKKKVLVLNEDYYPVQYSASGKVSAESIFVGFGISAPELNYNDLGEVNLRNKIAVMDIGSPDGIHPHSKYLAYHDLKTRIDALVKKGAAGVVLINLNDTEAPTNKFTRWLPSKVPVVYLKNAKRAKKLKKKARKLSLNVELEKEEIEAKNVVGYLNNNAEFTVVIGAHYDHLGMGGEGSLHRGELAIHNGADDNASGVAALMELAYSLSKRYSEYSTNFLFIAFSGEEKGLLGSNFFAKSMLYIPENMKYMINMDMIGRLNEEHVLMVNGVGTSRAFKSNIRTVPCAELLIRTTDGGTGPSDHTSFYNINVPAIHFFTGAHEDYHKPSDDFEKINFRGLKEITKYLMHTINTLDNEEKMEFTQTKSEESMKAPAFTVTLGVIPDYLFDKEGMRIDGVTEGRPASKAGLLKGDIVVQLGVIPVRDMMSYMKALASFEKGDKTKVEYLRNGTRMEVEIEF